MTKAENIIGAILAAACLAATGFVAGRWSTTTWPVVGSLEHACAEYVATRAAFVKAEREFERQRNRYRYPLHAAVYRSFEGPERYLARVSTDAHRAEYVRKRDDCARWMATGGKR